MNHRFLARRAASLLASFSLVYAGCTAHAAGYLDRPVRVLLPFPAGTVTDVVTRLVTTQLAERLGQPFVVENKPGGYGSIGAAQTARSTPDGYTILFTTNTTHSIISSLVRKVPYDPQKDFTPIAKIAYLPSMVIVGPSLPVHSLRELVRHARAHPGAVRYGFGNSSGQIGGASLRRAAGVDMIPIPYKGNPQGIQDLMGGNIDAMVVDITTGTGAMKSGKIHALAVLTTQRMDILPEVPTMDEEIGPGNDNMGWFGVFGPADTPHAIVATLATEIQAVIQDPPVVARLKSLGVIPDYMPPEKFVPFLAHEQLRWTTLAHDAGISPE